VRARAGWLPATACLDKNTREPIQNQSAHPYTVAVLSTCLGRRRSGR